MSDLTRFPLCWPDNVARTPPHARGRVEWNLHAIAKDIEAQRARERWGCGSIEQAFRGYLAIPERCGGRSWWDVLGVPSTANTDQVKAAYKQQAAMHHPDAGGSTAAWEELQRAYEQGLSATQ